MACLFILQQSKPFLILRKLGLSIFSPMDYAFGAASKNSYPNLRSCRSYLCHVIDLCIYSFTEAILSYFLSLFLSPHVPKSLFLVPVILPALWPGPAAPRPTMHLRAVLCPRGLLPPALSEEETRPLVLLLIRLVLAIPTSLSFHINFWIGLLTFTGQFARILIGTALHLHIKSKRVTILMY